MEFLKPEALKTDGDLSDNFKFFRDEVDFYFIVTESDKLSKELQVEMLIELLGPKGWELYCSLTKDVELDVTLENILSTLETHCVTRNSKHKCTNMEIFNFLFRKQQWNESFEEFLADLKRLVKLCDFGDQENKLLQYQIVMGIYCSKLQTRLLKKHLTLEEIINISTSSIEDEVEIDFESEELNKGSEGKTHEEGKLMEKISPEIPPEDSEGCYCDPDKLF